MYARPSKTVMGTSVGRPCQLLVPNGYTADRSYPLITFWGNFAARGIDVQGRVNMDRCMDFDDGSLVLVPDGTLDLNGQMFLNASAACCDKFSSGVDDLGYGRAILDETIAAGWRVDLSRVWQTGYSNGGCMCHSMACHHNDRVTLIMSIAGAHPTGNAADCLRAKNVSALIIHADGDTTVPFNGGLGNAPVSQQFPITGVPSAAQSAQAWADFNGIIGAPVSSGPNIDWITTGTPSGTGAETTQSEYPNPPADGHVAFDVMIGASHTMTFSQSTFAGQKLWKWAYPKPRVS